MLVLTRKEDGCITIGENVRVRILEIRNGRVRIGIEAPLSVSIRRDDRKPSAERPVAALSEIT